MIDRPSIEAVTARIAPYVRHTPVIAVGGEDFGLGSFRLTLKLEFLQHWVLSRRGAPSQTF